MNSFFLQWTSTLLFSLASYLSFFFIQTENNLLSSSTVMNVLSVTWLRRLRAVITIQPTTILTFTPPRHSVLLSLFLSLLSSFYSFVFQSLEWVCPLRTSTEEKAWERSTFRILTYLEILPFCSSALLAPQFPRLYNGRVIILALTF